MPPIPDNLENILNPMQLMTLRNAENDGWELCFVRRDGLEVPVPVIKGADSKIVGVIEEDGRFNANSSIRIRISPEESGIS
jgi:hypothetical protein